MPTRDQIAVSVLENLASSGIDYYTSSDVNEAIQDGYDEVAVLTGCIQKSATINVANTTYYDMLSLIPDYFAVVAAYNNTTLRWILFDNLKVFDTVRIDWETWAGMQPMFGSVSNFRYIALVPILIAATGTITIYYRATAPTLAFSDTPLIHIDEQVLLEWYATADLLDQAQEFIKADKWWTKYFKDVLKYKERIGKLAKSDYLPVLGAGAYNL